MKIAILANAANIHAIRWANSFVGRGFEVHLITLHPVGYDISERVIVHKLKYVSPLGYILGCIQVRRLLATIKPDLLNAHYATGYGLLARLSKFHPLLLSVWGSDVYLFPKKSFLHRAILKKNLASATAIGSTSECMAQEAAATFAHKHVFVTPFGIDIEKFIPKPRLQSNQHLVIGTIKTLKHEYGIDTLIKAFALLCSNAKLGVPVRLEITGGGPDLFDLQALAARLNITDLVTFHGPVPHEKVPEMLNRLDVYVALSRSESFGVAILEASACEKPVVVSDADGPKEVTLNGVTGLIVKKDNSEEAAAAIFKLVENVALRTRMGKAGRQHVVSNYNWEHSIDTMLEAYKGTVQIGKQKAEQSLPL